MTCTLCQSATVPSQFWNGITLYTCQQCMALLKDPSSYPTMDEEKARYDTHNNDVHDPGYQNFVRPVVQQIKKDFSPEHTGLDYGCGPGPVITHLLKRDAYPIALYDPIYAPDTSYKEDLFDFIICSEVAEHFHDPAMEFAKLKDLLKPGGKLYCMTSLYHDQIDFDNWYYKNDKTHVIFYTENSFKYIQKQFGFTSVEIMDSLIVLTN